MFLLIVSVSDDMVANNISGATLGRMYESKTPPAGIPKAVPATDDRG